MINDPVAQKLNKFLETHTFTIPIFQGTEGDPEYSIEIKLRLTGEEKLITVGEWKDYYSYDIIMLPTQNKIANLVFTNLLKDKEPIELGTSYSNSFLYHISYVTRRLLDNLFDYYTIDRGVIARKIVPLDYNNKLNESIISEGMYDGITRKIVRDITNVFKKHGEGQFSLPEDLGNSMNYQFNGNINPFSIDLKIQKNKDIDGFEVDGEYYIDEDVIHISIIYDPSIGNKMLFELIGELNDLVRHELEHIKQNQKGFKFPSYNPKTFYGYYKRPHELEAQFAGFKRRAKLEKKDVRDVAKDWFKKTQKKHNLTANQIEKLINLIIPSS